MAATPGHNIVNPAVSYAKGRTLPSVSCRDVEAVIFQTLPLPRLSLPLPLTKSEKTTVDNFFNFCGSVACLLLHFIILKCRRRQAFCGDKNLHLLLLLIILRQAFCGDKNLHLLLLLIILRGQKPSFIAITLSILLELIIPNYSVFLFLRY